MKCHRLMKVRKAEFTHVPCGLPKRMTYPAEPHGYAIQDKSMEQHPFYITTASEYGRLPPKLHDLAPVYVPRDQSFTNFMSLSNPYRNYSLNS